jgi:hypothetical protein
VRNFRLDLVDGNPAGRGQRAESRDDGVQIPEVAGPAGVRARGKGQELFPRFLAEGDCRARTPPELLERATRRNGCAAERSKRGLTNDN